MQKWEYLFECWKEKFTKIDGIYDNYIELINDKGVRGGEGIHVERRYDKIMEENTIEFWFKRPKD